MNTITINRLNNKPEALGASSGIGNYAIQIPDSFEATKIILEDVPVQKKDANGALFYEAYKDADGNWFSGAGDGLTIVEATQQDLGDVEGYNPVMTTEQQNVQISSKDRLKDFTLEEIITAKGQALLVENPTYTHAGVIENEDFNNVWDFANSDNFIAEYHQATLHPSTTIRTIAFPLQITASEIMCIWDFDSEIDVEISLDGGTTFTLAISGVPEVLSGNTIIVKCTNTHATDRKAVRGFSMLYN